MKSAARIHAEQKGREGETLAAWYLRLTGWRILARRQKIGVDACRAFHGLSAMACA